MTSVISVTVGGGRVGTGDPNELTHQKGIDLAAVSRPEWTEILARWLGANGDKNDKIQKDASVSSTVAGPKCPVWEAATFLGIPERLEAHLWAKDTDFTETEDLC